MYNSPVYEISNVAIEFGLFNAVKDMIMNVTPIASKGAWSKLIWERAWKLDDANWRAANTIYKDNDLLTQISRDTRYLTWWRISDSDYRLVKMCETMSKILCHTSLLKRDDVRLKGLPMSNRTCVMCNMYCIEDIVHIVNQCPFYHTERIKMYEEIHRKCLNVKRIFDENAGDILYYLLGRAIPRIEEEEMMQLWSISGTFVCKMYNKAVSNNTGVG